MGDPQASSRISRLATGHVPLALLVLAGLLWASPSLQVGLLLDDRGHAQFVQTQLARGALDGASLDMFGVWRTHGAQDVQEKIREGLLPWWTSADFSVSFFRPLAVATHYLDYGAWPRSPWLMHAHNLLWYGAMLVLLGLLYRKWLGAGAGALVALFLFAIDEAHVAGAGWLAGRNTLMTTVFVLAALLAHARARRGEAGPRGGLQAPLLLLLGFASSEGAISAWAYLIPYAWLLDRGRWRARWMALTPMAIVTIAWQLLYRALGHGARGSELYADPGREPLRFLLELPARYPTALKQQFGVAQLLGSTADLVSLAGLAVCCALLWWLSRDRRLTTFLLTSTLLAALPLCTVVTTPRLLFPLSIGACALLSQMLLEGLAAARGVGLLRRGAASLLVGLVLALHVALPALLGPLAASGLSAFDAQIAQRASTLPWGDVAGSTLVVAHAPDFFSASAQVQERILRENKAQERILRENKPQGPARTYLIGTGEQAVSLTRIGEHTLVFQARGGYLAQPWARVARAPGDFFSPGDRVQLRGMLLVVDATTMDGRPARVRIELDRAAPQSERLVWVYWNVRAERYQQLTLPPIGQTVTLETQ